MHPIHTAEGICSKIHFISLQFVVQLLLGTKTLCSVIYVQSYLLQPSFYHYLTHLFWYRLDQFCTRLLMNYITFYKHTKNRSLKCKSVCVCVCAAVITCSRWAPRCCSNMSVTSEWDDRLTAEKWNKETGVCYQAVVRQSMDEVKDHAGLNVRAFTICQIKDWFQIYFVRVAVVWETTLKKSERFFLKT